LPTDRFERLFTAAEANELIPRLEVLMRELQLEAGRLRTTVADLTRADRELASADFSQLRELSPELKEIANRMADMAAQIESFGCVLKDIEQGLVDFPFDSDGEVAFLCWQYGEPHVIAWHSVEGGFDNRRPLRGAPKTYLN
jgi:hypothetical protein